MTSTTGSVSVEAAPGRPGHAMAQAGDSDLSIRKCRGSLLPFERRRRHTLVDNRLPWFNIRRVSRRQIAGAEACLFLESPNSEVRWQQ